MIVILSAVLRKKLPFYTFGFINEIVILHVTPIQFIEAHRNETPAALKFFTYENKQDGFGPTDVRSSFIWYFMQNPSKFFSSRYETTLTVELFEETKETFVFRTFFVNVRNGFSAIRASSKSHCAIIQKTNLYRFSSNKFVRLLSNEQYMAIA